MNISKSFLPCRAFALAAALFALPFTAFSASSPLDGAWSCTEASGRSEKDGDWKHASVQPSLMLFVDGHYSLIQIRGEKPRERLPEGTNRDTLTEEQLRAMIIPFVANAGTFEITGDTFTRKPIVTFWPNGAGQTWSSTFKLENGVLTLTATGKGWQATSTWKRATTVATPASSS